jgi:carbon monoxide dehydrogenase subunit G
MDMQGSRELPVTQAQAWAALNDPEVLKQCIPGCDKVEATGENQYAVGVAVKIGPVSAKFNGRITLSEVNPPQSYTLSFDGQGGAAGFGKGTAQVKLVPATEGNGCVLSYTVAAQVGGKIAQMGQRLIDGVARGMAEDFFKRFEAQMQERYPQVVENASAAAAESPAAGTATDDRAPGGLSDKAWSTMIPSWTWVAALGAVALAAWWMTR